MDCVVHGIAESDMTEQLSLSLAPNNGFWIKLLGKGKGRGKA